MTAARRSGGFSSPGRLSGVEPHVVRWHYAPVGGNRSGVGEQAETIFPFGLMFWSCFVRPTRSEVALQDLFQFSAITRLRNLTSRPVSW